MKIYYLYKHIFPNNKVYIGITCQTPYKRWRNGYGYKTQPLMWKAIKKYGWDNIQHEICVISSTKEFISQAERDWITKIYKSNDPNFGYNIENGGNYTGKYSEESILKRSIKLKGRKITKEQRLRISNSLKKYFSENPKKKKVVIKKTKSEALAERVKGCHWWNNGKINKYCKECPPGFKKGMLTSDKFMQKYKKRSV